MAEEVVLRILPIGGSGISGASPTKGASSGGGMLGGLGKLVGIVSMIGVAVQFLMGFVKDVFAVFKPVMAIIKSMARMIGTFLQPIAEIMIILIRPLLDLIRPLVILFRAIMAPVMSLIREFSMVMNQQMAAGDTGGAAITGMNIVGLALSSFFVAMADVIGTMLIDIIGGLLSTVTQLLISTIGGILATLVGIFSKSKAEEIRQNILDLNESISVTFKDGMDYAKEALHTGTGIMMDALINRFTSKLEDIKSTLPPSFSNTLDLSIVKPIEGISATLPAQFTETLDKSIVKPTEEVYNNMKNTTEKYMNPETEGSVPKTYRSGLMDVSLATEEFTDYFESAAKRLNIAANTIQRSLRFISGGLIRD